MKLQISLVASFNLPYHFCLALLQCEHPQKLQNCHIPRNYKTIYRWHSSNFQARLIVFHGCNFCLCCFLRGNMFHQFQSTIYKKTNFFVPTGYISSSSSSNFGPSSSFHKHKLENKINKWEGVHFFLFRVASFVAP